MTKPSVIILEGPDGGGKSTLAKQLEEKGFAVRHTGPPAPGEAPYSSYIKALSHVVVMNRTGMDPRPYVFDRLHLGERVYGPVVRNVDKLGPVLHRQFDRILMGINAIIVYCATDRELMENVWRERASKGKELITDTSRYNELFNRYEQLIRDQPLVYRYDYQLLNADDVDAFEVQWPNGGPGIGAWRPGISTLLVGDIVRESISGLDWPFTGRTGSSTWLTQQLLDNQIPEETLYWVNAHQPDTLPRDPSFIELLQPKRTFAMGQEAHRWLQDAGVPHKTVDHPQYWKRFMHYAPYPLIQALKEEI